MIIKMLNNKHTYDLDNPNKVYWPDDNGAYPAPVFLEELETELKVRADKVVIIEVKSEKVVG